MSTSASFEPKMLHAEQVSEPKQDEKPWLRQKNEPALWFMRFKRYLDMGSKRTLRAVVVSEPQDEKAKKGNKNQAKKSEGVTLSLLSVPGAWSRAAKVWNWKGRAEAYDSYLIDGVVERHLGKIFDGASLGLHRIELLKSMLQSLQKIYDANYAKMSLDQVHKIMAHMQSILKDIREEMTQYDEAVSRVALTKLMGDEYRKLTPEEVQTRTKKQ
jgi:hypothetical protein